MREFHGRKFEETVDSGCSKNDNQELESIPGFFLYQVLTKHVVYSIVISQNYLFGRDL